MKDDFKPRRPAKAAAVAIDTQKPLKHQIPVAEPTSSDGPIKVRIHKRVHWWLKSLSRKQQFLVLLAFLMVVGGIGFATWQFRKSDLHAPGFNPPAAKAQTVPATTVASRMTGRQIDPVLNDLPATAVMIENSTDARPQSGLLQADMVFEAIAEGGITRFVALYQESKPDYIGPVRSVRPYYLDFFLPYQASIAHAGGSNEALSQVKSLGVHDLDYAYNASTYDRINSRPAPHNLYTSRERLLALQAKKGYTTSSYTGFKRKADAAASTVTARSIDLTISSSLYNPHFDYDAATNSYKRSEGGQPHLDEKTKQQINPKVVVALVSPHSYIGIYSSYQTIGSGPAVIFQDGVATSVTWSKSSRTSEFIFKDAAGTIVPLNAGQTWISLVSASSAIKYAP